MNAVNEESIFFKAGQGLAETVFHPDYYKGEWYVKLGNRKKVCKSHTTALAWANYLRRNDYRGIVIGKVFPK